MSTTSERCASCGARATTETGICAYCGSGAPAHGGAVAGSVSSRIERFDRLAEHADFDRWMRYRPKSPKAPRGKPSLVVSAKPFPAIVVAKRTGMSAAGSAESSRTWTSYFVTLEFRTGTRFEYEVDGEFHGTCVENDIGVAYFRGREFEGFKRFDV